MNPIKVTIDGSEYTVAPDNVKVECFLDNRNTSKQFIKHLRYVIRLLGNNKDQLLYEKPAWEYRVEKGKRLKRINDPRRCEKIKKWIIMDNVKYNAMQLFIYVFNKIHGYHMLLMRDLYEWKEINAMRLRYHYKNQTVLEKYESTCRSVISELIDYFLINYSSLDTTKNIRKKGIVVNRDLKKECSLVVILTMCLNLRQSEVKQLTIALLEDILGNRPVAIKTKMRVKSVVLPVNMELLSSVLPKIKVYMNMKYSHRDVSDQFLKNQLMLTYSMRHITGFLRKMILANTLHPSSDINVYLGIQMLRKINTTDMLKHMPPLFVAQFNRHKAIDTTTEHYKTKYYENRAMDGLFPSSTVSS